MSAEKPYREDPADSVLLSKLRSEKERYVSGADLSRSLKVSRNAVWKHIRHLRALGFTLEGRSSSGYRLLGEPDSLRPEVVASSLTTRTWGRPYRAYESVESTNDVVHALARAGAPAGLVVSAETQTRGRGRLGRGWHLSKGKGLAFSVLLRPTLPPERMPLLTLASAVGTALAIEDEGAKPGIKWPNDLEIHGRKVGGILTEAQADLDHLQYAVVGIGLNVNQGPCDYPADLKSKAVSLAEALGRPVDRPAFFRRLLARLEEVHAQLEAGKGEKVLKAWRERATVLGRQVRVAQGDRTFFGQALDVDEQGALWVRNDLGLNVRVTAGDVEALRLVPHRAKKTGKRALVRRRL